MKEFMDLIAQHEALLAKRRGRLFEHMINLFGASMCVSCGQPESSHVWLCDTCDVKLPTELCGCGAAHLPKMSKSCAGHGGAHLCCPASEN